MEDALRKQPMMAKQDRRISEAIESGADPASQLYPETRGRPGKMKTCNPYLRTTAGIRSFVAASVSGSSVPYSAKTMTSINRPLYAGSVRHIVAAAAARMAKGRELPHRQVIESTMIRQRAVAQQLCKHAQGLVSEVLVDKRFLPGQSFDRAAGRLIVIL